MKDKELPQEENQIKKNWEAPKLICLDKGKTENGGSSGTTENAFYYVPS